MNKAAKMICAGVAIASLSVSAFAAGGYTKQATLEYDNIKIQIDGQQITPKDPNGKTVEPFIINGTTYLPVRAVADAVGCGVAWDGKNNTVLLNTDGTVPDVPTTVQDKNTLYDKSGIKVTLVSVENGDKYLGGKKINIVVKNNSDRDIYLQTKDGSVDGVMCTPSFSVRVLPGKTANTSIDYPDYYLESYGVKTINSVEFRWVVLENDTWYTLDESGYVTIDMR